jgi:hypothetical protein
MPAPSLENLDRRLIAAHAAGDGDALVLLYREAGEASEEAGDTDRACFFFVHAYVFALESGHRDAEAIRARLKAYGRES